LIEKMKEEARYMEFMIEEKLKNGELCSDSLRRMLTRLCDLVYWIGRKEQQKYGGNKQ